MKVAESSQMFIPVWRAGEICRKTTIKMLFLHNLASLIKNWKVMERYTVITWGGVLQGWKSLFCLALVKNERRSAQKGKMRNPGPRSIR